MATGSFTINITIPVTGAGDPDRAARGIVEYLLVQAAQVVGVGPATGGNLIYPPGPPQTVVGNWTYTAST